MDIPILGFGTWQLKGKDCVDSALHALKVGYRHIDTADSYGNHLEVAQVIKSSGIKREELFVTTKVPRSLLGYDDVLLSCDRYLAELGIPYIDLLLIHWPNKDIPIEKTLEAFERLKQQEKIKEVGVSNFTIHHLEDIQSKGFKVVNNQIELHPTFNQLTLQGYCDQNNIRLTAYSPVGRGVDLDLGMVKELAMTHGRTPSQIILRWIIQRGIIAIPKSTNPKHIEDNFNTADFELTDEEVKLLNNIPQEERIVNPPTSEFSY